MGACQCLEDVPLGGRGQECCLPPYNAQDSPTTRMSAVPRVRDLGMASRRHSGSQPTLPLSLVKFKYLMLFMGDLVPQPQESGREAFVSSLAFMGSECSPSTPPHPFPSRGAGPEKPGHRAAGFSASRFGLGLAGNVHRGIWGRKFQLCAMNKSQTANVQHGACS